RSFASFMMTRERTDSDRRATLLDRNHPRRKVDFDEVLCSRSAGESHRDRPVFAIHSKIDIEKWTAEPLLRRPLDEHRDGLRVAPEIEFVTVWQLANSGSHGTKRGPELVKVTMAFCGVQRVDVAGKRRFGGWGGKGDHEHQQCHSSSCQRTYDFKSS